MSRSRRAPEWWPDGEPWPPRRWRDGRGPWRHAGGRGWRPVGCLVLLLGLFAAGAVFMALWALAAIVGLVEAPPLVSAAGVVAFIIVLVGGGLVARSLRRLTAPLDALIEASGRIEAGDYSARVPVSGTSEIRSLARAFNGMSTQLQLADERRRAFLADVTHELRTPLTVIQGQLEAIEDGVYEADRERVTALLAQARQMAALVEDLRTISLAEVGALELRPEPLDLVAFADEMVAGFAPMADRGGVALHAEPQVARVVATLDRTATGRVVGNLLSNALRHTPSGGVVTLRVGREAETATIEVADSGRGMDAELAARAFERFEKGAGSPGSGLGLAIARELVEAQGGTIGLRSTPGQGTQVIVRVPATEDRR